MRPENTSVVQRALAAYQRDLLYRVRHFVSLEHDRENATLSQLLAELDHVDAVIKKLPCAMVHG